jgi:probable F420-dependent oxidoreductase
MPKIDLGHFGAVLSPAADDFVDTAVRLEGLGYSTIWLTGGPLSDLAQIAEVVEATETARVARGIIPVDRFPSQDVAALYARLEQAEPGRFVVGLGGAHGPKPLATLNAYLDRLDQVPQDRRVMAALGRWWMPWCRGATPTRSLHAYASCEPPVQTTSQSASSPRTRSRRTRSGASSHGALPPE